MKPIQLLIDEPLLRRLDADPEVKQVGRSEVLRRAAAAYLRRSRSRRVAEAYAKAYGRDAGLGDDWAGWEAPERQAPTRPRSSPAPRRGR